MDDPVPAPRKGRASTSGSSVEKALRVLEASAAPDGPHRLAEIAAGAAVSKPSAHRILGMLAAQGYVVADGAGTYGVGPRLRALAAGVGADETAGIDEVLASLQHKVGNTVHLALRSGDTATYIRKVDTDRPYRMASRVGMRLPLHCTAIGKCVLAHLPAEQVEAIAAASGLPARTANTITDLDRLHAELARVREHGVAVDDEENEETIRCLGAPVFDADGQPVGGISISTVTFLVPREEIESYAPALREAATALTGLLR
ncbi:IclR family transcriptional regulator [Actinomadura vinacea]|uniref:IclR family transcriptional regulator n=1 Tax=Actinomadura vinacea TaxID=115336 RepID=A0ABN3J2G8_9ACTN